MVQISKLQLASMIILFEIGSSPLFLLAGEAKRDAWIAVTVAMLSGLAILAFINLPIQKQEPDKDLVEISRQYMGFIPGTLFSLAFAVYFLYASMRNVREFGDLTILYLLPGTPLSIIMLVLVAISGYAISKGVEVFFRVAEYLLPMVLVLYFLMFAAFVGTGLFKPERLFPLFAEGVRPVLEAGLPEVISFPFGEISLFLMFWKYMKQKERLVSVSIVSYILAGIFIILSTVVLIAVLGPLAGTGGIPMMLAASLVQIARVVERMDPLVALLLFTGVIMKQTAYYLGAVLAVSGMTRYPYRVTVLMLGMLLYAISFVYPSHMMQIWVGFEHNTKYHFPFFTIIFPILLWLVMKIRGRRQSARPTS